MYRGGRNKRLRLRAAWAEYVNFVGRFKSAGNRIPGKVPRKPQGTQYLDALAFRRFIEIVGNVPVGKISVRDAEAFRAHLRSQKNRRGEPLRTQTVLRQETPIRAFLRWCVRRDYLKASPYDKLDPLPYDEEQHREALTWAEARAMISAAPRWLSCALFFLASTGARRSQVCFLTWSSICFHTGFVTFKSTRHFKTKSRRPCRLPMSRGMRKMLLLIHRRAKEQGLSGPDDFVFRGPSGEFIRPDRLTKEVGRLMKRVLKRSVGAACHAFRWFAATVWAEAGSPTKTTAALLGLSTDRVLQRRYHQVRESHVRELVNRTALPLPRTIPRR